MKNFLLLPVVTFLLLPSCVTYDPDYLREVAQIQDIEYPAKTIVGMWMQVGYRNVGGFICENRVYDQFNSNGTGVTRYIRKLPAVYSEYKDLYPGIKNFGGEQTLESNFTWRYLGKNKWEYVKSGNIRIISDPPWLKTTLTGKNASSKGIVRFHNNKLFFPDAHCTAVSMADEAAAKAKLATIRALKEAQIRTVLHFERKSLNYQKDIQKMYSNPGQAAPNGYSTPAYGAPNQGNSQGYNSSYGSGQSGY